MPKLKSRELQDMMLSMLQTSFGNRDLKVHNAMRGQSNTVAMLYNTEEEDSSSISQVAMGSPAPAFNAPGQTTIVSPPESLF